MFNFIESILAQFKPLFSRKAAYRWFAVVGLGLMCRSDNAGVTSFNRALGLNARSYDTLLHLFRSDAFNTNALKQCWIRIVSKFGAFVRLNNRVLLVGDGTKVSKEGRHMPGVKKLFQESENSSKPQYIFGHMLGSVGAVIGNNSNAFCIPLDTSIQDGLRETAYWEGGDPEDALSHVVQIIHSGHKITQSVGSSYLVLDRYFLTKPAIVELDKVNAAASCKMDIITRAKTNCIAYEAPQIVPGRRGRPPKKGEPVKLNALFKACAKEFVEAEVTMYDEKETVHYLCRDLLWGQGLYHLLRFVLVKRGDSKAIFVSTDTSTEKG